MKKSYSKIIAIIVLIMEFLTLIYLSFLTYLFSIWHIDDSIAFNLKPNDWTNIAVINILKFSLIGLIFSATSYIINNYFLKKAFNINHKKTSLIISIIAFLIIFVISIIGGVQFAITKPWF